MAATLQQEEEETRLFKNAIVAGGFGAMTSVFAKLVYDTYLDTSIPVTDFYKGVVVRGVVMCLGVMIMLMCLRSMYAFVEQSMRICSTPEAVTVRTFFFNILFTTILGQVIYQDIGATLIWSLIGFLVQSHAFHKVYSHGPNYWSNLREQREKIQEAEDLLNGYSSKRRSSCP